MYGVIFIYICHKNQPNVGKCIYNKWILWAVYIAILENTAMVQPMSQVLIFYLGHFLDILTTLPFSVTAMQPSATTTRCLYNSLNIKMISGKT